VNDLNARRWKVDMTMELEATNMHQHKALALAVTRMVQRLARRSRSQFERVNHEWRLTPDDWLKVKFFSAYPRGAGVRVCVGLPARSFPAGTAHWVTLRRWPGWSGFWIRHELELPVLERILNHAFDHAQSDYRALHGKPGRQPKQRSGYHNEG
jgi:hypothetical protein